MKITAPVKIYLKVAEPIRSLMRCFGVVFFLSSIVSCKVKFIEPKSIETVVVEDIQPRLKALKRKKELYLNYVAPMKDLNGWLPFYCDALLFNSLYAVSGGSPKIDFARNSFGKWYRSAEKNCYPELSKSEISKDMFVGLLLYLYKNNRLQDLILIQRYGVNNNWIMGKGPLTRTVLMPDQRINLANAIAKLSGKQHPDSKLPSGFGIPCEDYGCHLRALDIYLYHLTTSSISKLALQDLKYMIARSPENALFRAIYSFYDPSQVNHALDLLLDNKRFPDTRLPSNKEHCTHYIYQRDQFKNKVPNKDWLPCDTEKKHTGLSFLLSATILIERIEQNNNQ